MYPIPLSRGTEKSPKLDYPIAKIEAFIKNIYIESSNLSGLLNLYKHPKKN